MLGIGKTRMSVDELLLLENALNRLSRCSLTIWEDGFVENMLDRLEEYEEQTIISDAQEEQINRMCDRYL